MTCLGSANGHWRGTQASGTSSDEQFVEAEMIRETRCEGPRSSLHFDGKGGGRGWTRSTAGSASSRRTMRPCSRGGNAMRATRRDLIPFPSMTTPEWRSTCDPKKTALFGVSSISYPGLFENGNNEFDGTGAHRGQIPFRCSASNEDGWTRCRSSRDRREDPLPILTGPVWEVRMVGKLARRMVPAYLILLVLGFFVGGSWCYSLIHTPIKLLTTPKRLHAGGTYGGCVWAIQPQVRLFVTQASDLSRTYLNHVPGGARAGSLAPPRGGCRFLPTQGMPIKPTHGGGAGNDPGIDVLAFRAGVPNTDQVCDW